MFTLKVSILIPVYNTQEYILECLESIAVQTFHDYEVIIVNDGSTDNSRELITRFISERKLDNFYLIDQEKQGLCGARNTGLAHAHGEWIALVDSDDWMGPNYLADMVQAIGENDLDYCVTRFQAYDSESGHCEIWNDAPLYYGTIPTDLHALSSLDYSWARMYRRSIIEDHGLTFDARIKGCEDNAFNYDYISHSISFVCVPGDFYYYRRGRAGALTQSLVQPQMRYHVYEHMKQFSSRLGLVPITEALNKNLPFSHIMWNAVSNAVIVEILNNHYQKAREIMKDPVSKAVIAAFRPRSKKSSLLLKLWKYSFPGLVILVKLYYGNYGTLKKHKKLFHYFSH